MPRTQTCDERDGFTGNAGRFVVWKFRVEGAGGGCPAGPEVADSVPQCRKHLRKGWEGLGYKSLLCFLESVVGGKGLKWVPCSYPVSRSVAELQGNP